MLETLAEMERTEKAGMKSLLLAPLSLSRRYELTLNEGLVLVFRRTKDFKVQKSFSLMAQICKVSCYVMFKVHDKISALASPG